MLKAIKAGGNYGEIFERNVGKASPLKLDRGLNATWNKGGLMYAIRSSKVLHERGAAHRVDRARAVAALSTCALP